MRVCRVPASVRSSVYAILLIAAAAVALEVPDELTRQFMGMGSQTDQERALSSKPTAAIDNSIDTNQYAIGMGDVFEVTVVDMPSIYYRATVNQNCDIAVSELGILRTGKRPLSEARRMLRDFVSEKLRSRGGEVYVSLAQGKNVSVWVGGQVAKPGTYVLSGALRVLDAIREANGGELPPFADCDYPAVECRLGDSTVSLDLFPALFAGQNTGNPYLYPGMRIALRKSGKRVSVLGRVTGPMVGRFPIRDGQTLGDLTALLSFEKAIDSGSILIQSGTSSDQRSSRVVSFAEAPDIILEDMMTITFQPKANYPRYSTITIHGEVAQPGEIAIVDGKTTVREVLESCGGVTALADPTRMAVVRFGRLSKRQFRDSTSTNNIRELVRGTAVTVRPEVATSLQKLSALGDYAVVAVGDSGVDLPLQSDDALIVPRKDPYIYVSGGVAKPGAYAFVPGKSHRYYVDQAGGYLRRASRNNSYSLVQYGPSVVIKPPSGVGAGDILVVPDREEAKLTRTIVLPIIQAIATTVTTAVAIISLSITASSK